MSDELRDRLARIDPMPPGVETEPVTTPSSRRLLEDIMSTSIDERTEAKRRPWLVPALAAAAVILVVGGGFALFAGDDTAPVAAGPPLVLDAGGGDTTMTSCIQFSVEQLATMAVAFEGTVTSIEGETVTLTVDEWFKGGDAAIVEVHAPLGLEALIGSVPFAEGEQFLITAFDGTVNYCGFSGPSTPEFRAAFEEAFGG